MRLWFFSDLHLEKFPYPGAFQPQIPDFDVLVCAGDIFEGDCAEGFYYLRKLAGDKPILFVMGNHEFWYSTIKTEMEIAEEMAQRYDITLLNNNSITIGDCHFIGGTLWTDYRLWGKDIDINTPTGEEIGTSSDDSLHQLFAIKDSIKAHTKTLKAFNQLISNYNGDLPLVVLSHHAPLADCLPERAKGFWAGNCASDLSALTDSGRIKLWLHGHLHNSVDLLRPSGTRIMCNPAGYRFENPHFQENMIIEI